MIAENSQRHSEDELEEGPFQDDSLYFALLYFALYFAVVLCLVLCDYLNSVDRRLDGVEPKSTFDVVTSED